MDAARIYLILSHSHILSSLTPTHDVSYSLALPYLVLSHSHSNIYYSLSLTLYSILSRSLMLLSYSLSLPLNMYYSLALTLYGILSRYIILLLYI
jgi:hypothetical protein